MQATSTVTNNKNVASTFTSATPSQTVVKKEFKPKKVVKKPLRALTQEEQDEKQKIIDEHKNVHALSSGAGRILFKLVIKQVACSLVDILQILKKMCSETIDEIAKMLCDEDIVNGSKLLDYDNYVHYIKSDLSDYMGLVTSLSNDVMHLLESSHFNNWREVVRLLKYTDNNDSVVSLVDRLFYEMTCWLYDASFAGNDKVILDTMLVLRRLRELIALVKRDYHSDMYFARLIKEWFNNVSDEQISKANKEHEAKQRAVSDDIQKFFERTGVWITDLYDFD